MHPHLDTMPGDRGALPLRVRRLGLRSYADACAMQERVAADVLSGAVDQLLLVEHPAVITMGRGFTADQLLAAPDALRSAGICVAPTDRGGGATYHGPGQVIGYPIVDLRRRGLGVRSYLRSVESALLDALRDRDIDAYVRPGLTGVWTDGGKVAAIGISVRRGVTRHGFALNVAPDLTAFRQIVPCGLPDAVTSMRALGWEGRGAALGAEIADRLAGHLELAAAARAAGPRRVAASPDERCGGGEVWA